MVKLEQVSFQYDNEDTNAGIHDISICLPKGSCTVVCGPSGSGKTTLLRLISGLIPAYYSGEMKGKITVNGQTPGEMSSYEKACTYGVVFQDPRSQFFMSNVWNEIAFTGENLGIPQKELLIKMETIVDRLGLSALRNRDLNCLSSGQKQKVAIASACLMQPSLLILDEPTANLDEEGIKSLISILQEIKAAGTAILISEHRLHCFLPVADQYLYLRNGELEESWDRRTFQGLSAEKAKQYGLRHPQEELLLSRSDFVNKEVLLAGQDIGFCYAHQPDILHGLDFVLKAGSVLAVVGNNGNGKTTFGKILCGLLKQKTGQILYHGRPVSAAKRNQLSYFVMQDADYQLYAESVGNELVLGRKITGSLRDKAYTAMELFDLVRLKDRHPQSLSGGEKQRVTLAAAYCSDAEIIVLDEPTSGLDAVNAKRVARFIRFLSDRDKTVVVITHDRFLIHLACDYSINIQ